MIGLDSSTMQIKGVGPKTSILLSRIGINTVLDLLMHFPRSFEDRNAVKSINILSDGDIASIIGEVAIIERGSYSRSGKHLTRIVFKSGNEFITAIWFNQKYLSKNFSAGEKYLLYGKISKSIGEAHILSPDYEIFDDGDTGEIVPVYPSTKNLSQKAIRNFLDWVVHHERVELTETIPEYIRLEFKLCDINYAIKSIHFPQILSDIKEAERRIKFHELFILQLGLMMERKRNWGSKGISFNRQLRVQQFIKDLPYKLTKAQEKAVDNILLDMESHRQMNRLIQGDVGSGKTIVAVTAIYNAILNGYQSAMMAPTEILASQHYETLASYLEPYGIRVALLSGKIPKKQKAEIGEGINKGSIDVVIGTHTLIQDIIEFHKLGLVITDEQHRFGVRQRAVLSQKGSSPDVLVMTATPIPRTMALFLYGDLDISIIDELPPGRQKIETYPVKPSMRQRVYNFVKKEIQAGRQAYVVCPIIEDSDTLEAESAVNMAQMLKDRYLKGVNVELLHGKMKPADKDEIMNDFKNGKVDVLVSTTVIEVGINVPNASIMVVESADRFGLAQLHQLRGRVGRGEYKSYCILIADMETEISRERLKTMKEVSDGFIIAERDMMLRGTGEFFGTRQHGLPELKMADIFRDSNILNAANCYAKELVATGRIYEDRLKALRLEVEKKFKIDAESITLS
jgi:ATP-dependent DNA helicase RecG